MAGITFDDLIPEQRNPSGRPQITVRPREAVNMSMVANDPPPTTGPRQGPAVPSTAKVWGDQEAEAAGLYEGDGQASAFAQAEPPKQFPPRAPSRPHQSTQSTALSFDDLIPAGQTERKPAAADIGAGAAALEGGLAGISLNARDEVYAASKASGMPDWMGGFRAPVGAARVAYESITGQPGEVTKTHEAALAEVRARQKAAQEQHPVAYGAGNVAGSLVLPVGSAMNAATLPGRMGKGAAIGAGIGGASGFGEGEDLPDRLGRAAIGGAAGAAIGGAAPPVVEGLVQGTRAVAGPAARALRGAFNPDAEAGRRVITTLRKDADADPSALARLTPTEFVQNSQPGGQARVVDMGGDLTRRLADSAGITSDTGKTALNNALNPRFDGQGTRIVDWLNDAFHFPNAQAQQRALDQVEKNVNRAGYLKAYKAGDREIFSPELERIMGSPAVGDAMRAAAERGKNRAVVQGYGAFNPSVTIENGVVNFHRKPNGAPTYPNLQFWDYTYRELRDAGQAAFRVGRKEEGGAIGDIARTMRGELDRIVPEFGNARSAAAKFFDAEDALEAGQNFVRANLANRETRVVLAKMSPTERQLFQDGFVSRFIETLGAVSDRRNVLNQIANSPSAREKLNIALGPERAAQLETRLRVEGIMDLSRQATQGNSWTAKRLYDLGLAGGAGAGAIGSYNMDPQQIAFGGVLAAISSGGKKIDQRVARRVAEMLVSQDPKVLQRGIALVAKNQRLLDAFRSTDQRIAKIGGGSAPTGVSVRTMQQGRAGEDEPEAPRPIGR